MGLATYAIGVGALAAGAGLDRALAWLGGFFASAPAPPVAVGGPVGTVNVGACVGQGAPAGWSGAWLGAGVATGFAAGTCVAVAALCCAGVAWQWCPRRAPYFDAATKRRLALY